MKSRVLSRLAKNLRSTHRKTKSWRITSKACKVLTEDGRVNPGLAKRIALEGYIPSDDVIERMIQHGAIEGKKKKVTLPKDLFEMSSAELLYALNNRTEMQPTTPALVRAFQNLGWPKRIRAGAR